MMAVGGNHKARQFFKQHGWDELGSDKIEGKVCVVVVKNPARVFNSRLVIINTAVACVSQGATWIDNTHAGLPCAASCCWWAATPTAALCCCIHACILGTNPVLLLLLLLQYTSRAAQLYRQQLEKEAAKYT